MNLVTMLVGAVLPYVAVLVFLGGMIYRINSWRKMASGPMTLFPAPADERANTMNTLKEVVFFKSLFRGDRPLWVMAWGFHVVLALVFVGHFRVFTGLIDQCLTPIIGEDRVQAMSSGAGGTAGVVILVAVAALLVRRLTLQRAREITGTADYLALALIGIIIITGNLMRFGGEHFDLALTREYFAGLLTFSGAAQAEALKNGLFVFHMGLAFLLIMAIPFSKILHLGGIFFTHQLIRKQ